VATNSKLHAYSRKMRQTENLRQNEEDYGSYLETIILGYKISNRGISLRLNRQLPGRGPAERLSNVAVAFVQGCGSSRVLVIDLTIRCACRRAPPL
jgi:hypothetical protein